MIQIFIEVQGNFESWKSIVHVLIVISGWEFLEDSAIIVLIAFVIYLVAQFEKY